MKLGGGLMLIVLIFGLVPYWLRRHARQTRQPDKPNHDGSVGADLEAESASSADSVNEGDRAGPGRNVLAGLFPPLLAPLLGAPGGSLFFPQRGSTDAVIVDQIFYFILFISIIFFVLIVAVMLLFVFKYRRTDNSTPEKTATHSNALEAVWSIIPAILVAIIFIWGFSGYMEMRQAPDDSYEIQVIAQKWSWSFQYPNGHIEPDLHVPADTNIRLVMTSTDVIHSLYIPAFRLKMDVVPGRYNKTWFKAIDPGSETKEYDLLCAEYCGDKHSTMTAKVVVHPSGEFEKWLEEAANFLDRMSPEEAGELLYQRRLCSQCHSLDGTARTGPTFKGIFGAEHEMTSGEKVTVDENYIQESIWDPQAKVRSGYKPVMPTYLGQLKEEEVRAIIAFIKTLK
jgi:cytochrome c oxidase subunit 2